LVTPFRRAEANTSPIAAAIASCVRREALRFEWR